MDWRGMGSQVVDWKYVGGEYRDQQVEAMTMYSETTVRGIDHGNETGERVAYIRTENPIANFSSRRPRHWADARGCQRVTMDKRARAFA